MQLNFDYLQDDLILKDQFESLQRLNKLYLIDDYRGVIAASRLILESVIKKVFTWENLNLYYDVKDGQKRNLSNDLSYIEEKLDYPKIIFQLMNEVRRMGNDAIHDANYHFTKQQAWHCICAINDILIFFINSYEDKQLNYLRPDVMIAAKDEPKFKQRKLHSGIVKPSMEEIASQNVKKSKEVLTKKKKRRFNRLRKFLNH